MSDEMKGKLENLKGRAKQAAGAVTADKGMEAEGAAERIKGSVKEKLGEARRKLKDDDDPETKKDEDEDE